MGLPGGVLDFLGKMGNRPDADPNTDTGRISSPNRGNYETYNPYQAQNSIDQAESDRKAIQDQIAQLEAKLATINTAPPDLGGMSSERVESSRLRDPHTTALKKKIADWRAAVAMRQGVIDQISALKAQFADVDKRVNAAKGSVAAEGAAKAYETRQIDQGAYDLMRGAAEGKAPSQAELMLANESNNLSNVARRQGNQMFNQNMSMVNSARSYNPGLSRAALFQNASQQADLGGRTLEGQQNLAGQSAAMRAQEMAAARGAYGQYALGQQQQNDQMSNQLRQINAGYAGLNLQGGINYSGDTMKQQALNQQNDVWRRETEIGAQRAHQAATQAAWSSAANTLNEEEQSAKDLVGGFGKVVGLSDERSKNNIRPVTSLTDQFAKITPVSYDYKPQFGGGKEVGVVAQDLEQTPVGKMIVGTKTAGGKKLKAIDQPKAVSTLLATAAEQAKRIKDLENKTGVGAIGSDYRQSLIATGENHPLTGRPILRTPSGDVATEMGITVMDPRLNGGKPTNLPSIWGGKSLGDRDAVTAALNSGQKFAAYKSIPAAVKASKEHSAELGRYLDESGKVRRDDISNGPIIPPPRGVTIDTSGNTILVDENVPPIQYFGPKKKYQGGQTLNTSDARDLFKVIGNENRYMDRTPAMQLFEENPPYVPQDAARYGREMMRYAQALKKRPGGIM